MTEYQELAIHDAGEVTVVEFRRPRITAIEEIEQTGRELYGLVETENRTKLVLDFTAVQAISSAMFGKLIVLNGKVKARNGAMRLCNLGPEVADSFHVCKLDQIFDIRQDEGDSLPRF